VSDPTDLAATLRETLAALAAQDPELRRFGAAHHRYELTPPLARAPDELAGLDVADFVTTAGAGGAGPGYGWIAIERAVAAIVAPGPLATWRALPIAHLGCGVAAVLPLDGPARGEIWIRADGPGILQPIAPSFTAFYLGWIDRLARGQWPDAYVPDDTCALPHALSGYLAGYEQAHGIAPGTLAGEPLRDALAALGAGAIEIAGGPPLFRADERVAPCLRCARLLDNLGLPLAIVAPGRAVC
jgi:hypothetical protein